MKTCKLCSKKYYAKGLCQKHYKKQYRQDNKGKIAKRKRQYCQVNKEHIAIKSKQYQETHKERIDKYIKQWRKDNEEKVLEQARQYQSNHKEHFAKYLKQWRQTPIGKAIIKANHHNRRILEKGLTKEVVQRVYEDNIKKYGTLTCVLCFKPVEFADSSLEHLTPLSRGGTNLYENLGVAHLNCNIRKGAMTLEEWFNRKVSRSLI